MIDAKATWGRLAVAAPLSVVAAVLAVAVVAYGSGVAPQIGAAAGVAAAAAAGWFVVVGVAAWKRSALAAAAAAVAAGVGWFLLRVVWPAVSASDWAMAFVMVPPLVLLPLGSVMSVRAAGERPPQLRLSWIAAVAALAAALPLVAAATTIGRADDMAALVVIWIPAAALSIFAGPLVAAGIGLLAGRLKDRATTTEVVA